MAGTGTWLLHGHDIGLPLEVDYGVTGDSDAIAVTGAKANSRIYSAQSTEFTVRFLKEFKDEQEHFLFRQQMEQMQNGVEFMPYQLETNQFAQEFHDLLVNIKEISLPREAGKVNWLEYEIVFSVVGHRQECIGYTQFRALDVKSDWGNWNNWKHVDISYPPGAQFHSDTPSGYLDGQLGRMEYRVNPSKHTIFYQEGVGKDRVGIIVKQNGVQLYSPFFNIGAGLEINNGYFKIVWEENGLPRYYRWNGQEFTDTHMYAPNFHWKVFDGYVGGVAQNVRTLVARDAIRTKLQLKKINTEFVEIEQEFQHRDGTLTAIQYFMNRGKNSIQLRARAINADLADFHTIHYIRREYVKNFFIDGHTGAVTDTTDYTDYSLVKYPEMYVSLHPDPNGATGYIGYVNPDKVESLCTIRTNPEGYVELITKHSWNEFPNVWSEPIMYFQGTDNPPEKRAQAGYLIKPMSQILHRSHVY